jgi:hypothetical protein
MPQYLSDMVSRQPRHYTWSCVCSCLGINNNFHCSLRAMTITLRRSSSSPEFHLGISPGSRKVPGDCLLLSGLRGSPLPGIYILSPLEEASRNSDDNFGFLISYLPSGLTTRVTSYSVRNTVGDAGPFRPSTPISRLLTSGKGSRGSTVLSKLLSNVALATGAGTGGAAVTAAFKALPAEHIKGTSDVEDPVASATTCRDAVNLIVELMHEACVDVGSAGPGFVVEEDIVRYVTPCMPILPSLR